jgi:putative colanic acid biosynthesis glycosyltransferase
MAELSIITICKDDPKGLTKTWKSVTRSIRPYVDWIVIDAASDTNTQQVLKDIRSEGWNVTSEPDDGIYDGMQKGLNRSAGKWVLFMNAGDEFADSDVLSDVSDVLQTSPPRSIVFGDAIECPPSGQSRVRNAPGFDQIDFGMPASHQSIFYRREVLEEFPFQSGSSSADWMQLLEMHVHGVNTFHIDRVICRFDTTGVSNVNWRNSITERTTYLKQTGRWNTDTARRYRWITAHATVANTLSALLPRSVWIRLSKFKRVASQALQGAKG